MAKTKLTRRQLALRIFGSLMIVNGILWLCFAPEAPAAPVARSVGLIELRIQGQLYMPFTANKSVILTTHQRRPIGPVILLEQQQQSFVVAVTADLYRSHHRELTQTEWAILPHIDGLKTTTQAKGPQYEISY